MHRGEEQGDRNDCCDGCEPYEKVLINGKNKSIKNSLIKADLVTVSIGNNDITSKLTLYKNYSDKEIYEYLCRRSDKRIRLIIYYVENNKKNLDDDLILFDYNTTVRARKMQKDCEHYQNIYYNILKVIEMIGEEND